MPIPNDYRELTSSLASLTDQGRVNWKYDGFGVEVLLEDDRLNLWAGTDEHTEQRFVSFALKDRRGETIDSWYVDEADIDYDPMNRFFLAAKRHALGIPDRLARIQSAIRKDGVIGKKDT